MLSLNSKENRLSIAFEFSVFQAMKLMQIKTAMRVVSLGTGSLRKTQCSGKEQLKTTPTRTKYKFIKKDQKLPLKLQPKLVTV
jgi:hypothetical protein